MDEVARPRRAVRGDHRGPTVGVQRRRRSLSPRTRSRRSTAARTGSTWSARCLAVIDGHLAEGGHALLQTGPDQPEAVRRLVAGHDALSVVEVRVAERGAAGPDRPARSRLGPELGRQHLVGAVAPRLGGRLAAAAHRRDRPGGAVLDAVVVDGRRARRAAASARPGRAARGTRSCGRRAHAATPQVDSSRCAVRFSRSRQAHAPNHTSGSSPGSSATSATQTSRSATCSCTASASTCSV